MGWSSDRRRPFDNQKGECAIDEVKHIYIYIYIDTFSVFLFRSDNKWTSMCRARLRLHHFCCHCGRGLLDSATGRVLGFAPSVATAIRGKSYIGLQESQQTHQFYLEQNGHWKGHSRREKTEHVLRCEWDCKPLEFIWIHIYIYIYCFCRNQALVDKKGVVVYSKCNCLHENETHSTLWGIASLEFVTLCFKACLLHALKEDGAKERKVLVKWDVSPENVLPDPCFAWPALCTVRVFFGFPLGTQAVKLWWAVLVFCHLPVPRHVNSLPPRNWRTCSCVMFPPSWAPSHEKCCTWSHWSLKLRTSRDLPPSSREWTLSRLSRQMMRFHVIKTRLWVVMLMTFYRPCHQKLSEMVRWFYIVLAHCNGALQLWL